MHRREPDRGAADDGYSDTQGNRRFIVDHLQQVRPPVNKTKTVKFRITEKEFNRVRMLAAMYAEGNVSQWIRFAVLEAPRKVQRK